MPNWADLKTAIRATGRFDRALIMALAVQRTRGEIDGFATIGLVRTWAAEFPYQLRLTWQVAKTAMDALVAERLAATLTPAERAACTLELYADIAASAIPPRTDEAAELRRRAAALRATGLQHAA
jgi:hypothetical protein